MSDRGDPNSTVGPQEARKAPTGGHVSKLTQTFKAMPLERFTQKLQRTIGGVLLIVLGVALLAVFNKGWLGKNAWVEWIGIGAIGIGALTASFEFISAPLRFAVAIFKDIWNIVRGRNGQSNGGTP